VDAYRDELGMLPEAVENYLLKLGWGHGDDEFIRRPQAIEWFDLDGIGRGPARFDAKKLAHVNAHYLRLADDARLVDLIAPRVEAALGRALSDTDRALLQRGMGELKLRAGDLVELATSSLFYVRTRPIAVDADAQRLIDEAAARDLIATVRAALAEADWTAAAIEAAVRGVADAAGVKLGKVAQPLRAAVTGSATSPGLFEVLDLLGRDEALGRLDDVIIREPHA